MGWSGGTYTKGNNSTGGWTGDASLGIGIEAGRHDTQDDDFANGINACLTKDGSNSPSANLPMGGYKHTGVAAASSNDEYTTQGQLQDGSFTPKFINPEYVGDTVFYKTSTVYNGGTAVERINSSKSTTVGVDTTSVNGDIIQRWDLQGYNGTGYVRGVEISGRVGSGTIGSIVPGEFEIRVGNSTGTALSTGLEITSNLATFLPGAYAITTANAANVYVFNTGGLARSTSSLRYKKNVQPMTTGLEAVKQLKPVTFNEKSDDSGKVFAGLIAEDLDEQGLKEYVSYDDEGRPDAIHYGNLVALAFKAIQELEAKVAALEAQVAGA
jgi:hypothetical protein